MSYTASSSTISPRRSPATSTVPTIASGSLSGSAVRKTSTGLRRQNTSQSTSRSTSITPRPWVPASAGYIISPHLQLGEGTAARIFHLAHTEEPLQRDRAAALTGVSRATVNRSVISLLEAELLEERRSYRIGSCWSASSSRHSTDRYVRCIRYLYWSVDVVRHTS